MSDSAGLHARSRSLDFFGATAIGICVALGFAQTAHAEEAPPAEPPAAETPAPEAPAAEPEYVPPPEASEGVGGWAVVDPVTGNVHGVIVGTIDTFNSRGGTIGHEYMGCHANCVLRFQTRATADGNVAGWHGTQTHIDANGNATQSNDGSVKWNAQTKTFSIGGQVPGGTRTQTLVPERTARDPQGMDLSTGIIDIETNSRFFAEGQSARVRVFQNDLSSPSSSVTIEFPLWSPEGKTFSYLLRHGWTQDPSESELALEGIGQDINGALMAEGYTKTETIEDPETGDVTESEVLDTENGFVSAIQSVTREVLDFLGSLLGLRQTP